MGKWKGWRDFRPGLKILRRSAFNAAFCVKSFYGLLTSPLETSPPKLSKKATECTRRVERKMLFQSAASLATRIQLNRNHRKLLLAIYNRVPITSREQMMHLKPLDFFLHLFLDKPGEYLFVFLD